MRDGFVFVFLDKLVGHIIYHQPHGVHQRIELSTMRLQTSARNSHTSTTDILPTLDYPICARSPETAKLHSNAKSPLRNY